MFIRFLIAILLPTSVFAQELKVNYGLYNYSLDISPKKLHLTGKDLDLSMSRNKCNEKMFQRFRKEVLYGIDKLEARKIQAKGNVEISFEKKATSYSPKTPQGRSFLGIVNKFKKLKIQENLKCKK